MQHERWKCDRRNNDAEDLEVSGNLTVGGSKSAVVGTDSYGERLLYAVEQPEMRFADEGLAFLENSTARIQLDPVFLETIEGPFRARNTVR